MWLVRLPLEVFPRIACLFRSHAYFLHSHAPLPAVLLLVPQHLPHLAPLTQKLTALSATTLHQQLEGLTLQLTEKSQGRVTQL
jgi:hypothetical protein